jgi:putative nucleotidyltransferase with HDIG domain
LVRALSTDQALVSNLLKLANSALYGFSRQVATVTEALVLVGRRRVRSLVLAASTASLLQPEVAGYRLAKGELWRHALACGVCARLIADQSRKVPAEEALVAGLLHDLGKVILGRWAWQRFQEIMQYGQAKEVSFLEAERAVLGFDHAQVGAKIAARWMLPEGLTTAIAAHHQPSGLSPIPPLAAVVHVADCLVLMMGVGLGCDGLQYPIDEASLVSLGLTEAVLENVISQVVGVFEETLRYTGLES